VHRLAKPFDVAVERLPEARGVFGWDEWIDEDDPILRLAVDATDLFLPFFVVPGPAPEPTSDLEDVHATTLDRTGGPPIAYLRGKPTKEERMSRTRLTFVLGLAAASIALAGCGGSDNEAETTTTETTATETTATETTATGTTLKASVGPGFDISLSTEDGQAVTTLAPGSYTIEVNDQSDIHNFHLTGAGVDEMTEVSESETETWTVELQDGSYHFQCDPHAGTMNGDFEVSG